MRRAAHRYDRKLAGNCQSSVQQQLAISACHIVACISDKPERMPPFAGAFPGRTDQRAVAREDQSEGDVVLIRAGIKRIVDRKQLDEPGPPIGGRRGRAVRANAKPACHPLEAGNGGEPDSRALVTQDHETVGAAPRRSTQAQAQPCRALGCDEMVFVPIDMIGERLKARRKRDRSYVCCLDHDHVGRGLRRPQRRTGARVDVRSNGESSAPTARPDPPLRLEQWRDLRRFCAAYRQNRGDRPHCAAGIPAQNPHNHGLGTDLRPLVTARKFPRT
jgi:hypothetical protein